MESQPSLTAISQAYDQRYAQGDLSETDSFYRWVLKHLSPVAGRSLLDVSCGEGRLLEWAIRLSAVQGWGVDISTMALRLSQIRIPQANVYRCDGIALPFPDNTFDYITNLGSLEHYTDIPLGIREMVRVLKPEGKAAILLPNSYYLVDILWDVWRTGYGPSHRQLLERFDTVGGWRDNLERGRFQIEHVYAYNFQFPYSKNDWGWYWSRPTRMIKMLISPFVPFNLSYCFLFICVKNF